MAFSFTFKRFEKKYLLSPQQFAVIKAEVDKHFLPDKYGETKICNIYFDTPEYILTIRSNDKPVFKEKLRLRTYGVPNDNTTAFIELKRKYKSVVYKRRISMPYIEAVSYLTESKSKASKKPQNSVNNAVLKLESTQNNKHLLSLSRLSKIAVENDNKFIKDDQIHKEIDYFMNLYKGIAPAFYISYDRSAFFYKETSDIRITFDKNITWRKDDLDLRLGSYGDQLLPEGYTIMEIKVPATVPLWLAELMTEQDIKPTSFSKVGTAYKNMISNEVNRKWNYSPVFSKKQ